MIDFTTSTTAGPAMPGLATPGLAIPGAKVAGVQLPGASPSMTSDFALALAALAGPSPISAPTLPGIATPLPVAIPIPIPTSGGPTAGQPATPPPAPAPASASPVLADVPGQIPAVDGKPLPGITVTPGNTTPPTIIHADEGTLWLTPRPQAVAGPVETPNEESPRDDVATSDVADASPATPRPSKRAKTPATDTSPLLPLPIDPSPTTVAALPDTAPATPRDAKSSDADGPDAKKPKDAAPERDVPVTAALATPTIIVTPPVVAAPIGNAVTRPTKDGAAPVAARSVGATAKTVATPVASAPPAEAPDAPPVPATAPAPAKASPLTPTATTVVDPGVETRRADRPSPNLTPAPTAIDTSAPVANVAATPSPLLPKSSPRTAAVPPAPSDVVVAPAAPRLIDPLPTDAIARAIIDAIAPRSTPAPPSKTGSIAKGDAAPIVVATAPTPPQVDAPEDESLFGVKPTVATHVAATPVLAAPVTSAIVAEPTPLATRATSESPVVVSQVALPGVTAVVAPPVTITQPAAQAFAAAMFAAERPARATDRDDPAAELAAAFPFAGLTATTPAATSAVQATGNAQHALLDTSRSDWMGTMIERIESLRDSGDTSIRETRMRLAPDALGNVDVAIRQGADGQVSVHITADTPAARAMLADAAPKLADMAEARGLKLGQSMDGATPGTGSGAGNGFAERQPRPNDAPVPLRPAAVAANDDGDDTDLSDTRIA